MQLFVEVILPLSVIISIAIVSYWVAELEARVDDLEKLTTHLDADLETAEDTLAKLVPAPGEGKEN